MGKIIDICRVTVDTNEYEKNQSLSPEIDRHSETWLQNYEYGFQNWIESAEEMGYDIMEYVYNEVQPIISKQAIKTEFGWSYVQSGNELFGFVKNIAYKYADYCFKKSIGDE